MGKNSVKIKRHYPDPVDINRTKDKVKTLWPKWIWFKRAVKKKKLGVSLDYC